MISKIHILDKHGAAFAVAYKENDHWKFFKEYSSNSFSEEEVEYILKYAKEVDKINSSFTGSGKR